MLIISATNIFRILYHRSYIQKHFILFLVIFMWLVQPLFYTTTGNLYIFPKIFIPNNSLF